MNRHGAHRRTDRRPRRQAGTSTAGVLGRARADRWPLVLTTLVVALAAFLATATPRLVAATGDASLRYAVRAAGPAADVTLRRAFDADPGGQRTLHVDLAARTREATQLVHASLAPALDAVLAEPVTTVATLPLLVVGPGTDLDRPVLRTAFVDRAGAPAVTWVRGRPAGATLSPQEARAWPVGAPVPVEVGLSQDVAAALGVDVGDTLTTRNENASVVLDATVSGIFRAGSPTDPVWSTVPGLLEPRTVGTFLTRQTQLTGLLSDASLPAAVLAMPPGTTSRVVTFAPDPDSLAQADVATVAAEVAGLRAAADEPVPGGASRTTVTTTLDTVLLDARARFRAAVAQSSVLLAGVLAVTLLTLLVAAALLVRRRATVLATYRARGASLPAIGLELGVESVTVAAVGCGAGAGLAALLVPGPVAWPWLAPVVVVAALAPPALAVRHAGASTGGRRGAGNRTERAAAAGDRRAARLAVEAAVVLLAVGALAALRTRGVVDTGAARSDPLLALAPTLGALAGAALLLRALPPLLRGAVRRTSGWRRAVPVLAAARAQASAGAALPFLALTLATSLVVLGATFVATVQRGEVDASWLAVGADVRVTSEPDPGLTDVAAALRTHDGVRTALAGRVEDHVQVFGPRGDDLVRLVVLPSAAFSDLLAGTPLPDAPELARLDRADPAGRPGVLLSAGLRVEEGADLVLAWSGARVDVRAVGTASAVLTAGEDTVVIDRAALERALGGSVAPDRLWVVGTGARAAVAATSSLADATVETRDGWLAAHRAEPLTVGVQRLAAAAAVVLLALTALVVVLASATSAPHRGRTLGTLRTLGLDGRAARTVTAGELLPGPLLAGAGGLGLGVLLAEVTTGPLALRLVTGQPTDPPVALSAWSLTPPVVVTLTVLALVLAESSSRRRERLGEILRVGGS
ncbi:FtsX-like permease family protein [Cellulomonas phragmiteti]|uniref:ABC3 transporter permease C-terminal domain-containing protein n=1 Tax=Cellulomonas phragmiteti TaxID=478780 RepID=A0ABQ4DPF0_9CELL|nr:FtsX-like permease family protein [Cellulomonas phragmiteti]GIG41218.1 hypothetical protein Cph01nite_29800 [Cellulomonas phragmiteti]